MTKKIDVINFIAGPGAGKSTGAAYLFSRLKMLDKNVELVTEYAKDKVWDETKQVFNFQPYLFGKQAYKMSRLKDKVDIIVTDSPLFLTMFYMSSDLPYYKPMCEVVKEVTNEYNNYNCFLLRTKPYNPIGRFQTFESAKEVDSALQKLLTDLSMDYKVYSGDKSGYDEVLDFYLADSYNAREEYVKAQSKE